MTHKIQHPENDGKVAVFDTYEEAFAAQEMCLIKHLENHPKVNGYSCDKWAEPTERLDGKFSVPVCHHSDATGAPNLVDYDNKDYYIEEDI